MPALYLDASFGLGGDMFLSALADLGYGPAPLASAFAAAGLDLALDFPCEVRRGLAGRVLRLDCPGAQPLRHLSDLLRVLEAMPLSARVKDRAARAFRRLAEVEAEVHGVGLEQVHFHEVGAVDTLVDVVGAFHALESLGVARVECSSLPWFTGVVQCAHGALPLPAPAALKLLAGKPVFPTDFKEELITPTGALILDQGVDAFVAGPSGVVRGAGLGYGSRDLGPGTHGLRAVLLDRD